MSGSTNLAQSTSAPSDSFQGGNSHRERIEEAAAKAARLHAEAAQAHAELTEALLAAHRAGASLRQIAPLIGASPQTVMRRLRDAGADLSTSPLDRPAEVTP